MKCSCSLHSPFLFRQHVRPSLFATDPAFYKGASTGKTAGQISTEAVERFTLATGRNPGSIFGISSAADHLIEKTAHERRKRSSGHYRGKA